MTDSNRSGAPSLAAAATAGYGTVLTVAFARAAWRLPGWPASLLRAVLSSSIVASLPAVVELGLLIGQPSLALRTPQAMTWVLSLAGINTLALVAAWRTWALFERALHHLDQLTADAQLNEGLLCWLNRALGRTRQIVWSVCTSVLACVLLAMSHSAIESKLELGPVSYLSVAWSGFLYGNCLYWSFALAEVGRRVLRRPNLNLIWHSPASTPGITRLSEMYSFLTLSILVAFVAVEFLNLRASRYGTSPVLNTLATIIPVGAAVLALATGLLPHMWLYRAVREARFVALEALQLRIASQPPTGEEKVAQMHARIELYRLVETGPGLPFSTAAMVQYGAAVLGTLLAYFLGR